MSSSNTSVVRWYFIDNIGVIVIDNPPVNAISVEVRRGIVTALEELSIADITHIILHCEGNTFCAGADIKEFGKPPLEPHLPDVVLALHNSPKPVIAIMHGTCLGGGLELAMACYARVATKSCRIGLPEVNLGLIPGAGGTQLLPKLIGIKKAAEMITSGKPYPVTDFEETRMVLSILTEEDIDSANDLLKQTLRMKLHLADTNDNLHAKEDIDWDAITDLTRRIAKGKIAPLRAIEVLKSTADVPLADGLKSERKVFLELRESSQAIALRHAFLAEKTAAKYSKSKDIQPVTRVAVIGGGTMGIGIATAFLNAGYMATLVEQDSGAVVRAKNAVIKNIQAALSRGLIDSEKYQQTIERLSATDLLEDISEADLVVEAIFEDMAAKQALFKQLDAICSPEAIFASNTSYLDIDVMAQHIRDPSRLIGMHFFSPAHIMKLLEVVKAEQSSDRAIATAFAVAKKARKIPVLVSNSYGFAGNRMYQRYGREIQQLLLEGASVVDVDKAMTDYGMAMGPLAVQDLSGIDVGHKARSTRPFPEYDPGFFKVSELLVKQGNLGRKTGVGFYDYSGDKPVVNPALEQHISELATTLGITQTQPDKETIQHRAIMALISEGYQLLAEGIVERASDLDVIWLFGYGFPRHRGGPMHVAETMGSGQVQDNLQKLRDEYGEALWPTISL